MIALVKATPQLRINPSVPSTAYDLTTHPFVEVRGAAEGESIGGYLATRYAREGTLRDGKLVVAIPLDSGGSGGFFTQIIFARSGDRAFAYAGHIDSGGHLDVRISGGVVVATMPYYGQNDAECCPSKYIVQTFAVSDGRLLKLSERFDRTKAE